MFCAQFQHALRVQIEIDVYTFLKMSNISRKNKSKFFTLFQVNAN